jgi:hypothetical protein
MREWVLPPIARRDGLRDPWVEHDKVLTPRKEAEWTLDSSRPTFSRI